ncbi:formimidoylglutamase [Psychroflexus sp. ALD_RP9]|uniref:formimidoylglutamase n=1 Tax=Psychroflexus sp. ALD_RP9 TaxID=2777186 RepID=UPI001A8F9AFD|nr:formimidoylglutamase [Psychroflexus sp. ALD_RP9]QSS96871.1 formimidoylglutamase [Psychroflexus sp. ALD_RP9]
MTFNILTPQQLNKFTKVRSGEVKFGESITCLNSLEELNKRDEEFVILGIPENIGIRANYGASNAHLMWKEFLKAFLNIQSNSYNHPEDVIILGEFDTSRQQERALNLELPQQAEVFGDLVQELDEAVSKLIQQIVSLGKTPIVIGGGHNNAYPIIKGVSRALDQKINVLNIDAHTDYRDLEHRHSGNGFSYARAHQFLDKYAVFGLHKNYTSDDIFQEFEGDKKMKFDLFENLVHLTTLDKTVHFKSMMNFLDNKFGLELDCDAIENFPTSASTPSGFSMADIRTFIKVTRNSESKYLHICEAQPSNYFNSGKALAYFVSDYIRKNKS